MQSAWDFLDGNKTKIVALGAFAVQALAIFGVIPQDKANELLILLGAGGVFTLRDAMRKLEPPEK